jgi:hypothetical protein
MGAEPAPSRTSRTRPSAPTSAASHGRRAVRATWRLRAGADNLQLHQQLHVHDPPEERAAAGDGDLGQRRPRRHPGSNWSTPGPCRSRWRRPPTGRGSTNVKTDPIYGMWGRGRKEGQRHGAGSSRRGVRAGGLTGLKGGVGGPGRFRSVQPPGGSVRPISFSGPGPMRGGHVAGVAVVPLLTGIPCGPRERPVGVCRGAGRIRTAEWRFCRPLPYHLATAPFRMAWNHRP